MTQQSRTSPAVGDPPLVSVIMNCLNGEKYLREAIDSVYTQSYPYWEIVFWDNASRDDSAAIARSFRDGRLRYFLGKETVPLGQARNLAIRQSKGQFIAFLDCDDLWLPDKLAKQVPLFLADEKVGLVYSDTYFFTEGSTHEKRLYAGKAPYRGHRFPELLNNYLISLETAMVRRAALDSLAYWFDENFNMIEEYDLFVRLGLDWKIDYVPDVLAKWRVHSQSWTWKSPDSFVEETRAMLEKLQQQDKISQQYGKDLALAWHRQTLSEAKASWRKGDGRGARRRIRGNPHHSLKACLLWTASFLPYHMVDWVHRSVFGILTPRDAG